MAKVKLGPRLLVYPMPAFLVGANVQGKPNFATVAWGGIVCDTPPLIAVALRPYRYTYKGIQENDTFSVNIPSVSQVVETDYCGIVSGSKADKADVCGYSVYYGELKTAPLISECPVNMECRVFQIDNLGSHALVIGEVLECYATDECLTEGRPDVTKINPFLYSDGEYLAFGRSLGRAFKIGRILKKPGAGVSGLK
jgi:flavin reductase (DIM6/NTAB) family NADH-FMN oxidoreductase RutF